MLGAPIKKSPPKRALFQCITNALIARQDPCYLRGIRLPERPRYLRGAPVCKIDQRIRNYKPAAVRRHLRRNNTHVATRRLGPGAGKPHRQTQCSTPLCAAANYFHIKLIPACPWSSAAAPSNAHYAPPARTRQ